MHSMQATPWMHHACTVWVHVCDKAVPASITGWRSSTVIAVTRMLIPRTRRHSSAASTCNASTLEATGAPYKQDSIFCRKKSLLHITQACNTCGLRQQHVAQVACTTCSPCMKGKAECGKPQSAVTIRIAIGIRIDDTDVPQQQRTEQTIEAHNANNEACESCSQHVCVPAWRAHQTNSSAGPATLQATFRPLNTRKCQNDIPDAYMVRVTQGFDHTRRPACRHFEVTCLVRSLLHNTAQQL
jgi:hypothetical protein